MNEIVCCQISKIQNNEIINRNCLLPSFKNPVIFELIKK